MKPIFLVACFVFWQGVITAQDTVKLSRKSFDSSMFAEDDTLTRNDYLRGIEKAFQTINEAPSVTKSVSVIATITHHMDEDESALRIIKERISNADRTLNIRNLQMFKVFLEQLSRDTQVHLKDLNQQDSLLDGVKKDIFLLRKDTIIRRIFRDPALWSTFKLQLSQLHVKWVYADSLIRNVNISIDNTLARISANLITIEELVYQADILLKTAGPRAFSKERNYIWEPPPSNGSRSFAEGFKKLWADEKLITEIYFEHTRSQLYLLLLTGVVFFCWVFFNFRSLKRLKKTNVLDVFKFEFVTAVPVFISLVFMLDLAPLFDLDAPAIYIGAIEFVLMLALTIFFFRRMPGTLFYYWLVFILLFILLSITKWLVLPFYLQRWWTFSINSISCIAGALVMWRLRKQTEGYKVIFAAAGLYVLFNLLAVLCNVFGRLTLAQLFSATGVFAFAQTAGLLVFTGAITEAFLLQIQSSRVRKNYPEHFEYAGIRKGIIQLVVAIAVIIWLIVFATNLNIYTTLTDQLMSFFTTPRKLGSFSFRLSGIILFLAIIWTANFLQKYIAYFFGDIGDDAAFDNKGQRSRLLITRLLLLTSGFLLAVAASGLPVDKITVILGALGVGVGLGLQSIVNNFVSGIILIFDRPLRIGDTVEIGDKKGRVKEISVRSSTLLTSDGAEVIIPNGDVLSHNIVNWTLSNTHIRGDISFAINQPAVSDDTRQVIVETIQSNANVLSQKAPEILVNSITAQSIQVKVYYWCKDVTKMEQTRSEIYTGIYAQLQAKGVTVS